MTSTNASIDFALRVCESIAFSLHGILGITEPFTGCLRSAFGDHGNMPSWFWPVAGVMLFVIAAANFSDSNDIVLAAQAYVATFHIGAFLFHIRLGHQVVVGLAPCIFVAFAFGITALRTNIVVALLGTIASATAAAIFSWILVTPSQQDEMLSPLEPNETSTPLPYRD